MKDRFRQFMFGRYGSDSLNRFLSISGIVVVLLSSLVHLRIFYWVGVALLIVCYWRMFSRNIEARSTENAIFYRRTYALRQKFSGTVARLQQSGTYRFYRCPTCGQQLRVPKGRGKISITCPKCKTEFIKKS